MREDGEESRQVALERAVVEAMYRRLDHALAEALAARKRALAVEIDGAGDLYARDVEVARLTRVIGELRGAERALCFGRIDAVAGGSLHIGRTGLRDGDGGDLVLVDWRADAARPFYTATPVSPLGLRRRRHLRLDGRTVVGVSDEILDGSVPADEDVVGDGPLADVLGRPRSGRMRDAVATLQAEQDAIVRSPHQGVTVVQGGPGTGKTIVALHRAAYVLYAFPRIADRGVLVFGPNHRFLDYISDVLPSLGENDVRLATATDLVGVRPSATESDAAAQRKGRGELAVALAGWVRDRQPHGVPFEIKVGHDTLVLDGRTVDDARTHALRDGQAYNPARALFRELVADELVDLLERRAIETLDEIDADVATMLDLDLDQAVAADLRTLGLDETVPTADLPEFDRDGIRATLIDDSDFEAAIDTVWPRLDATTVLADYLKSPTAGLTHADLALLDEVRSLVDGPPEQVFGHIVVDEAQELTEMEWRMLMRRCPARSMTVVGDFAQSGSGTTIHSWTAALGPFVGTRFEPHTLTVNYRTTAEILDTALPLLARIAPDQEISRSIRHGEPPRIVHVAQTGLLDDLRERLRHEAEAHPGELVGVISTAGRAAELAAGLDGTGAITIAAPDARGLEFDAVLVVDPAGIEAGRTAGPRDLYVAMTRATKRLYVIFS
ncbi:HelD family protein [Acrocarpospora catenulata]|uniref:HelD family protein n=1 Tax=Acrocarpospora catenulata TaxID=2836182 RepID=UPI002023A9B8|nr:ATP-binding domain-containing protein [Acrocarpospora catenulata]